MTLRKKTIGGWLMGAAVIACALGWRVNRVGEGQFFPEPPMLVIMPEAISFISAMAFFIFMSSMPLFSASSLALAEEIATSRDFSRFL